MLADNFMRNHSRLTGGAVLALLLATPGCGTSDDDDDDRAAPHTGSGGNACVGPCPSSGSGGMQGTSGSGGQLAGTDARGSATGGRGGAGAGDGSGGTTGTGGVVGGADGGPVVVPGGTCPNVSQVVAAGEAWPGFAVFYEDPDIFSSVDNVGLSVEHVYFTAKGLMMRVAKTGGMAEMVRSTLVSSLTLTPTDAIWAESTPDNMHRIVKSPLGSSAEPIELVAELTDAPKGLTTDASSLYWTGTGPGVSKVALSGGAVEVRGETVAVDSFALLISGDLYALSGASLMQIPGGDTAPTMVAQFFFGGEIVSDGLHIYMADSSEGTLKKWSPGATSPELVATKSDAFASMDTLFALAGSVYWAEDMPCDQLFAAAGDGSRHVKMMDGFSRISDIAGDASGTYVADQHGLYRMER